AAYPDIQFQAERLSGHYGSRRFDLGGLTANLALADDALSLRSITGGDSGAGPVLSGFGQYRLGDKFYYLWLEGRGPQLPGGSDEPLVFMIDVWGNGDRDPSKLSDAAGTLNLLYLRDSRVELTGTGVYDARLPKPCALNVSISKIPAHAAPGEDPPLVAGDLSGDAYLAGTVRPMDMEIQFWLNGRDLAVGKRMIGDVKVELTGSARPDGTVSLQGKELELLEGTWRITALSRRPFEKAKVNISFTDLPAAELAQVAGSVDAPLDGTFRGAWAIDVDTTRGNAVTVGGVVEGSDLAAGPIKAATMSARTTLRQGRIALDPVLFRQGDGEARFAITTTTDAPQQVRLTLAAREWPVELTDGLALTATSDAAFDVDLKALGATGTVTTRVAAKLGDKDAGDARVRVTTRGRVIRVESLAAEVVGGTVEGNTTIDLTRPLEAIGRFSFANLSGERMVELVPAAKGLTGTYHGTLAFSPATGERPLGPLEGRLTLTPTPDAAFRGMRLGDSRVQGYLG
ncbi:MAG TPA: hypothetical protein VK324_03345, partial [Tepidisphaeraceae bacterium]|nr:hypothetical protein [Tepidisphaeraceae bacterium]